MTAVFSGDNASDTNAGIAEIYAACAEKRNGKDIVDGLVDGKDAVQYAIDAFVRNTFARYIGAIYRADADTYTVSTVTFDGKYYTWNTTGRELKGSNWRDADNKTLVSAVADTLAASKCVELQLLDANENAVSLTFKAENVPTKADLDATLNAELYEAVLSAGTYNYLEDAEENKNWMPFAKLAVNGTTVTADFTADESVKAQIQAIYDGLSIDKDGTVTGKGKEARAYAIDKYVMNTFARYLGALYYKDNGATISKINYDNGTYQWDSTEALIGSNWKEEETTLVSAVVNDQENKAIRNVTFTLVGKNGKEISVSFIASNVPNVDIIITEPAQE